MATEKREGLEVIGHVYRFRSEAGNWLPWNLAVERPGHHPPEGLQDAEYDQAVRLSDAQTEVARAREEGIREALGVLRSMLHANQSAALDTRVIHAGGALAQAFGQVAALLPSPLPEREGGQG